MNNITIGVGNLPSTVHPSSVFYSGRTKWEGGSNNDEERSHFFSQLAASEKLVEFKETILYIVKQLGFTDYSFTVLKAPPAKSLTTLPEKVHDFYIRDNFVHYDFFLEHAAHSNTCLYLSSLEEYVAGAPFASERIHRNAEYHNLLASLGYHDGYGIPLEFGRHSRRAMFALFARDASREAFRDQVEQFQTVLPMIAGAVAYFGFARFPEYFLDASYRGQLSVTPKPLRMLEVVAKDGLPLKDAAKKLKVSLDTANKHIAAAKKGLGATTLAHAIYLAMVHGLIKNEDGDEEE